MAVFNLIIPGVTFAYYVSSFYGSDSNAGTAAAPFKTLGKAHSVAATGAAICCSGFFSEVVPATKALRWYGNGIFICDGAALSDGVVMFNNGSFSFISGALFVSFTGTKIAVNISGATTSIENLRFDYCNVAINGSSGAWKNVIFNSCNFSRSSNDLASRVWTNCIFVYCSGTVANVAQAGFNIENCVFYRCENFRLGLNLATPGASSSINYNMVIGFVGWALLTTGTATAANGTGAYPNTQDARFQSYNRSINPATGAEWLVTDVFNNYDPGSDDTTYRKNNFTLKSDYLNSAGKDGIHLGALPRGFRVSAADLMTTYKDLATNFVYEPTIEAIRRDPNAASGAVFEYRSLSIPIPESFNINPVITQLRAAFHNAYAQGQVIDYTPDAGTPRLAHDFLVAFSPNADGSSYGAWQSIEVNVPLADITNVKAFKIHFKSYNL